MEQEQKHTINKQPDSQFVWKTLVKLLAADKGYTATFATDKPKGA